MFQFEGFEVNILKKVQQVATLSVAENVKKYIYINRSITRDDSEVPSFHGERGRSTHDIIEAIMRLSWFDTCHGGEETNNLIFCLHHSLLTSQAQAHESFRKICGFGF